MTNLFNLLSKFLAVIPAVMFLYDAIKGWFVDARFKIRTLKQWWTWLDADGVRSATPFLREILTQKQVDQLLAAPGPVVMLVPPLVFYVLYRLMFSMAGGKNAGGMVYKSRH